MNVLQDYGLLAERHPKSTAEEMFSRRGIQFQMLDPKRILSCCNFAKPAKSLAPRTEAGGDVIFW